MITYEEALRILLTSATVLPGGTLPLFRAAGRVTGTAIAARLSVPNFANAAMDGYVVSAAATESASPETPVRLPVTGLVTAGGAPPAAPRHDRGPYAWEILTGAPVPPELDAVVPLEQVTRSDSTNENAATVLISQPLKPGQNIRRAGEDFVRGQAVLEAGVRLSPHHLMGLAACGVDDVPVVAAPRVAVLTTGNELTNGGTDLAPGRIRDANGPYLRALLPLLGAELTMLSSAADSAPELHERLRAVAIGADVIVTTGGVSAGRFDLLPGVVRDLGGEVLFHKVAIRPGKPILHARLPGGALLFGLPGNPLAVAVGMRFFVVPALRALQGLPMERVRPAVTRSTVRGRGALRFLAKAFVEVDPAGQRWVRILPGQESFRIAPLLQANCWAIVPEGVEEIPAGGTLCTLPLYPDP